MRERKRGRRNKRDEKEKLGRKRQGEKDVDREWEMGGVFLSHNQISTGIGC